MQSILKRILKSLLLLLALGLLLTLAGAAFLYGWVVPRIDDWRPRIERYLSEQTHHTVRIGFIAAQATGLFPSFEMRDVEVLGEQAAALKLGRVQVEVSPLSMLTFEIARLRIDAPTLHVSRDVNGIFTLAGWRLDPKGDSGQTLDWLFEQKEIVIQGGTVHWSDAMPHLWEGSAALPQATLEQVSLSIKNGLRTHDIRLQARLTPAWVQQLQIKGHFSQPLLETRAGRWQAWHGSLELQAQQVQELAQQINISADWPLKSATLQAQQLSLKRLADIAQWLGRPLPAEPALELVLGAQAQSAKLQIKALQSEQPQLQLQAGKLEHADWSVEELDVSWKGPVHPIEAKAQIARLDIGALLRDWPARQDAGRSAAASPMSMASTLREIMPSGQIQDTQFVFKGLQKNFPWPAQKGDELRLKGKLVDARILVAQKSSGSAPASAPGWPALEGLQLAFDLNDSHLNLKDVRFGAAQLAVQGTMQVPDLRKPVLQLKLETKGALSDLLSLIKTSPIPNSTKNVLASSEAEGAFSGQLQASIPLAQLAQSKISGAVQFQENNLLLNAQTPLLTKIKGTLNFSQSGFQLDNVRAQALGGEIRLGGNQQRITGTGTVSAEGLAAWPSLPLRSQLLGRIQGKAAYSLALDTRANGSGLTLESNLVGLQIDVPAPLKKNSTASWPLRVTLGNQGPEQDRITVALSNGVGPLLAAAYQRDTRGAGAKKSAQVLSGALELGTGVGVHELDLTHAAVVANLHALEFDWNAWSAVLGVDRTDTQAAGAASDYMPTQITARIDALRLGNREFQQVVFGASKPASIWRVSTSANDFNGYAEYRPILGDRSGQIYLRLARLSLPDNNSKNHLEQLLQNDPERIPALDAVVDELEVTGKKVGRLEIQAQNQRATQLAGHRGAQEWKVQKLTLTNPDAALKVTGVWSPSPESFQAKRVDLQFTLDVNDAGALFTRFGAPNLLQSGKGSLQGQVAWRGSPWSLHYPSLTGQVKLDMSKGQFLKIEPGSAGRLLSVLSLQALPKLLTLDFRDVFSQGFAFDSLGGDAQIQEGILEAKNLQMKSTLALVSIDGTLDLNKETQNLHVLVLPDVNAGGVSLLATLVNPVVGAATYLAQLILRRPVIAAATKEYSIQGSWQEPIVTQIKTSKPSAAP